MGIGRREWVVTGLHVGGNRQVGTVQLSLPSIAYHFTAQLIAASGLRHSLMVHSLKAHSAKLWATFRRWMVIHHPSAIRVRAAQSAPLTVRAIGAATIHDGEQLMGWAVCGQSRIWPIQQVFCPQKSPFRTRRTFAFSQIGSELDATGRVFRTQRAFSQYGFGYCSPTLG